MTIDFDSFFRNRIESMLVRASWAREVLSILGLRGMSQVWSGQAAWYLWLQDAAGAYGLAFQDAECLETGDGRLVEGWFALKCYPDPGLPAFAGFSAEERSLATGAGFDKTRTPCFEASARIPESLFGIGTVSFLLEPAGALNLLTFDSQERLVIRQEDGRRAVEADAADPARTGLLRDVPGWELGCPLFSCLVGLCALFLRQAPVFIGASQSTGIETVLRADQGAERRSAPYTTQRSLSIGFDSTGGSPGRLERFWRSRLEPEDRVLFAGSPEEPHATLGGKRPPWDCGSLADWHELASREFASDLASTCGCTDQAHPHPHGHQAVFGDCAHGKNCRPGF